MAKPASIDLAVLLEAAEETPESFSAVLAQHAAEVFQAQRVVVAISDQQGRVYRIKGAVGFPAHDLPPSELARTTTDDPTLPNLGSRAESGAPATLRPLFAQLKGGLQTVFVDLGPTQLTRISPAPNASPLLLISLACGDPAKTATAARRLRQHAPAIARLYIAALHELRLNLRAVLVEEASRSSDLGSLLHRVIGVANRTFHSHLAAAFIPNPMTSTLDLRSARPRPKALDLYEHYTLPYGATDRHMLADSMRTGRVLIVAPAALPQPFADLIPEEAKEVAVVPLLSPAQPQGVLVLAGRQLLVDHRREEGTFLWEDVSLLEFYSDVIAILVQMLRARDEAAIRVERVLHGAKAVLTLIRSNLTLLEEMGAAAHLPQDLEYFLPDSIALVEDLSAQIERKRLSSLDRIDTDTETKLYGDVLAKLSGFAPRLARAWGRNPFRVNTLDDPSTGIRTLPIIRTNPDALLTVFRNLIHNAVKYSLREPGFEPWLHLSSSVGDRAITIFVSDNGIGIEEDEWRRVFEEGYRSRRAIALDPTGTGVGLADCREIMTFLSGSIEIVQPRLTEFGGASTTIAVRLPMPTTNETNRRARAVSPTIRDVKERR